MTDLRTLPPNTQANRLLSEVDRVLCRNTGRYLVVTLGQDFIMKKLLETFGRGREGWRFDLHMLEQAAGSEPSAFLTLVGIASRAGPTTIPERQQASINIHFDATAKRLTKPMCFTHGVEDHAEIMSLVGMTQERYRTKHELRQIIPGRFKGEINIWLKGSEHDEDVGPRYTLSIVDLVPSTRQPLPAAVFIIPQGREHDYLFSTPDGLRQVSKGDYGRSSSYLVLLHRPMVLTTRNHTGG